HKESCDCKHNRGKAELCRCRSSNRACAGLVAELGSHPPPVPRAKHDDNSDDAQFCVESKSIRGRPESIQVLEVTPSSGHAGDSGYSGDNPGGSHSLHSECKADEKEGDTDNLKNLSRATRANCCNDRDVLVCCSTDETVEKRDDHQHRAEKSNCCGTSVGAIHR